MERQFQLILHYGPNNNDLVASKHKTEIIGAISMIELASKFTILVAKLDKEFYDEDIDKLKYDKELKGWKDDIPF